jgi:hypothetical protein
MSTHNEARASCTEKKDVISVAYDKVEQLGVFSFDSSGQLTMLRLPAAEKHGAGSPPKGRKRYEFQLWTSCGQPLSSKGSDASGRMDFSVKSVTGHLDPSHVEKPCGAHPNWMSFCSLSKRDDDKIIVEVLDERNAVRQYTPPLRSCDNTTMCSSRANERRGGCEENFFAANRNFIFHMSTFSDKENFGSCAPRALR